MPNPIKLYFINQFSEGDREEQAEAMGKYFQLTLLDEADVIFCGSIMTMDTARKAKTETSKPLAVYCWDYYTWAHEGKHHLNWPAYADLLRMADIIFVPSNAQKLLLKKLLNLESVVVRSGIKTYEHKITDAGFILDPLRYYPFEQAQWPERAAKELGIPFIHSEHQYSETEFKKLVASCTFMTCAVPEASTGGLTLSEGLWLGKQSLVSDSPFQGASDYLKNYGTYFDSSYYENFKNQMELMWKNREYLGFPKEMKEYMTKELSFDRMARELYEGIQKITHSNQ